MANLENKAGKLVWNVPIVNKDGTPTNEFMLKWLAQSQVNGLIPGLGTPAEVSAVLDVIASAKGDLLVRDTTLWTPFTPGTTGSILRANGAGNLPEWDTLSTLMDLIGSSRSMFLYRGASGWTTLSADSGKILQSGSGAADPAWKSISEILDTISSTRGTVLYRGASGWSALAPGTAGYVLSTGGTGADPSWIAAGGGGGGYSPGTPPTVVQTAFNTSGTGVTFGVAPTNGNLLVSFTFNSSTDAENAGWTRTAAYNSNGTDWGQVDTHVCGASESTAQKAVNTAATSGGVVMYELHKGSGTPAFVAGASQTQQSGTSVQAPLFPNVSNCIGISVVALVGTTINFSTLLNVGTQDVLSNTGNRRMAAASSDLGSIPMVGLLALLSGSGSYKGATALFS